jgi:hypothetical protein
MAEVKLLALPQLLVQMNHCVELPFVVICPPADTVQWDDKTPPQFG